MEGAPASESKPSPKTGRGAGSWAVVTGASTGIGLELARLAAEEGFDLVLVADEPSIHGVAEELRARGGAVESIEADLATIEGNDRVLAALGERPVGALFANAGRGLGRAFLDQEFERIRHVVDTNVTGTLYLIHAIARDMRRRGAGRILITGSIAGHVPGTFQAVYNASKSFLDSFALALRAELENTGVTVTCLQPGPTETEFFRRADLLDTRVGTDQKQPAAEVARIGFEALLRGDAEVIAGLKNKLQVRLANVLPGPVLAALHRKMAEPGSARRVAKAR